MNVAEIAQRRYTTKAFDPARKISETDMAQIETLLCTAPSSVNSQPWHFVVVSTPEGKERLTVSTRPASDYNSAKIRQASHVLVLCARQDMDSAYLDTLLNQEVRDGRFPTPELREGQGNARRFYTDLHRNKRMDLASWMDKQVYIALGMLLFGAAALNIDSCAIEGFDAASLDTELALPARGLRSVVMVALGYRSDEDFNADLPKSRLPASLLLSRL